MSQIIFIIVDCPFFDAPAAFELQQTMILELSSTEVQALKSILGKTFDGLPHDEVVGAEVQKCVV